jgi:hypothetical protein
VRYLHLRLAAAGTTLHPLVSTLTDEAVLSDASMLNWAPSLSPPRATVLLYLEGDLDHFEAVLDGTDLVLDFDVTPVDDGRGYAYVFSDPHPTEWKLFEVGMGRGLLPVFPLQYHPDGSLTVRILGPTDRLQAAVEAVPEGVETTIERVGEYDLGRPPIPPGLPPRQREALRVAYDAGYYEVPRETSRDEVAERLGCAPSTASEHLRKAERRLASTFLDREA